ncbi:MAG: hypothetical protein F4123_12945 [Gemmatimonadetes bacterium]|nr:hypothetical protein [Gemmatimonadota bacterium]
MTTLTHAPALTALNEDEAAFREAVREFAESEIAPRVERMDADHQLDSDLISLLFDLGFMGIEIPEHYGGIGSSFFTAVLVVEEVSRVDPSVGVLVDVQNTLVNNALLKWGTEEQLSRHLPRLAAGTVGGYALSEAGSGSDAFALGTRATRDGDDWVLSGSKMWITNGAEAGLFIVFANARPEHGYKGITAFIVERDTPGFSVGKKEKKLGICASSS